METDEYKIYFFSEIRRAEENYFDVVNEKNHG